MIKVKFFLIKYCSERQKMGRTYFSKVIISIFTCILCASFTVCLCACHKKHKNNGVNYASENDFEYTVTDGDDALVFEPKNIAYKCGLIFYTGMFISPQQYAYLCEALAKQGYLVVISKLSNSSANSGYLKTEPAFAKYPNVKFFIGGHDMGGGAAIRRAQENPTAAVGVLLYAPLVIDSQVLDENGKLTYDEDGNVVKTVYSIAQQSLPTLLIEVDEILRTEKMKSDIKSRINRNVATEHTLSSSTSNGFVMPDANSESSAPTADQRQAQLDLTVQYTLAFLRTAPFGC